jgi:dihydrodipicolinate synthase/N-acetylneuraminate lyase
MKPTSFHPSGIYSAQWIPTDASGAIDRAGLATLIDLGRRAGISGVLALGSTGEFPQFSPAERKGILDAVAELAAPLPVMANISDIRPRVAIELGRHARSLGYAAVALMPPSFYPVSQADMLAYFLHVAEAVDLPVMLYNFPELCGKRIDLPTIAAFADRAPMAAIKQSGGEFAYHRELIPLGREKGFVVMSGADTRLPEVFALGAAGCIGGLVNIVPEWMVSIHRAAVAGGNGGAPSGTREPGCRDFAHGGERKTSLPDTPALMLEVGRVIDQLTFPLNVAAGIEARGLRPGAPKTIVSAESRALYAKIVAELAALFAAAGLPSRAEAIV